MKICTTCKEEKSLDMFTPQKAGKFGVMGSCKKCVAARSKKWREDNPEKRREVAKKFYDNNKAYFKAWNENHREERRQSVKKWEETHPKEKIAHWKVRNALQSGKLKKLPCFICGSKAIAHHPDYDRPLDVVWLCHQHHKEAHMLCIS